MPFDFPSSPTVGQPSNGYQWDGEKWTGGAGPAAPQKEVFLNLAGLAQIDVTVPTWARGAVIDGSIFVGVATNYPVLQFSVDGSTFYAGTSYSLVGGPYHYTSGTNYNTQGVVASPYIYLSYPKNSLLIPHTFQCQLSLESNSTSQLITARAEAQAYDNATGGFQMTWLGYLNVNLTPPARVQKLRIYGATGAFANGYVKIRWIGAEAQIPTGNAIPDAPSDGAEYVRVNGIWRKKCETLTWTARANTQKIICPSGATKVTARIHVNNPSPQAGGNLGWQGSQDGGATFISGASSYYRYGVASDSGNAAAQNIAAAAMAYGDLGWMTNNVSVGAHATADIMLARPAGSAHVWHSVGGGYYDTGSLGRTWVVNGYCSTGFATTPINALLFFLANSNMDGGTIACTWGYG